MVRRTRPSGGSLFDELDPPPQEGGGENLEYVTDPSDGLPAEVIKHHTHQKYELIRYYVKICAAVRRQWKEKHSLAATYIDLYCGPGLAFERATGNYFPGSPLLAWETSCIPLGNSDTRFTHVFLGDADKVCLDAAAERLRGRGAQVSALHGTAEANAGIVVKSLPKGFHFALLDPYSLGQLPFAVIEQLASVPNLDLLIHFSELDLRLNLDFHVTGRQSRFDGAVPGWRDVVRRDASSERNRIAVRDHWFSLIAKLGRPVRGFQSVKTRGNVQYYLALFSSHALAKKFWDEMEKSADQLSLG